MPVDYYAARQTMVESQVRVNDVPDIVLQSAMRTVPREQFCGGASHLAYADAEVEYAPGLYLLRPRDMSKLLQAVRPRAGEKALAIAAPYAGAVLKEMGLTVDSAEATAQVAGAYDLIICEGAVSKAPQAWLDALAVGGRLAVIERSNAAGSAKLYLRTADGVGSRTVFDAAPPVLAGFETPTSFAF
jgi:protein-L-isoaspartate(D-aspartate) O-methyltransferase